MPHLSEEEWKLLEELKPKLLNLASAKVLQKVKTLLAHPEENSHDTYRRLWRLLQEEDDNIVLMFKDFQPETAIFRLLAIRQNGLLSDEEMNLFSEKTRQLIEKALHRKENSTKSPPHRKKNSTK